MGKEIVVIKHPLIQHKLSFMRQKETSSLEFRALLKEISFLLAYEIFIDVETTTTNIETPLKPMVAPVLADKHPVLISILRAGNGFIDGILEVMPTARVGHIGLYRDEKTHEAIEYYFKLPEGIEGKDVIIADPMLATGHTATTAIHRVKNAVHPRTIKFLSLIAAPEGIKELHSTHPEVKIYTAAIDEKLNENAYILPGLGDAGDRIYDTKKPLR